MKKKILLSLAAAVLITFTGCGDDDDSHHHSSAQNSSKTQSVKVVDGYVIGAKVCDAKGVCADTNEKGVATAAFDLNTTLTSKAGYIDVNNNAKIDSDDIELPAAFELKAPAGVSVISPVSDLVANGADKAKLAAILGVDESALFSDPIATNNIDLAKAIQIVYALKSVGKETDLVAKVNSYQPVQNASQGAVQSELPNFDEDNTNTATEQKNENNATANVESELPAFRLAKVNSELPDFDEPVVTADNEQNAETNNTQNEANAQSQSQNTVTGGIAVLAQLAQEVAGDNEKVKALIQAVINANVTNAAELESAVASVKKELVAQNEATQEAAENAQSEAQQAAENAQNEAASEANETAENAESEANETAQSAQSEAEEAAENAQNETNETADNETENEEIQTPPSVPSELPDFD